MHASPPDLSDPASRDFYAKKVAGVVKELLEDLKGRGLLGKDGMYRY